MRRLRLFALLALCAAGLIPSAALAQTGAPVQIGVVALTKVGDWESGTSSGVLVTNNGDGELRLAANASRGTFESGLLPTNFRANAVGVVWNARLSQGTQLTLEVRGGPAGGQLGDWQVILAGDTHPYGDSSAMAVESLRALPNDTNFLQLRATLSSTIANASPELFDATLSYYNTQPGPTNAAGLPRVPTLAGAAALTPAPLIIERQTWSGGAPAPLSLARATPRGIVIHQIGDDTTDAPLQFLRAMLNYNTKTLGWDDLPYHYVIDRNGLLYEGRAGGPTSVSREKIEGKTLITSRMAGGDAVIHIALIGSSAPSTNALTTLHSLLAWLGQAYRIAPLGTHRFTPPDGAAVERPNIATHGDSVPAAADPASELRGQIAAIRQAADAATVRARYYFAEGNTLNYAERLAVFNPGGTTATVRFILLPQGRDAVVREVTIAAGGRADPIVNDIVGESSDVPAIIESNAPVLAERYMDFGTDLAMAQGVRQPSRVWYFAEGATDSNNRTYLLIFNPQLAEVQASITYIRDDGIAAEQMVRIPALQRRVVVVGDKLSGARFGMRVVATRPVVIERTMVFGQGSSDESGGVHTTPGVTELARRWYFAEGTTATPFEMSILVMNPNAQPVQAAVTFMTSDGTSLTRRYAIPATTRLAIPVNEVVPQLGVATTVVTDRPVAVERTITWNNGTAGTAGAGATEPAYTWRFVDGRTADVFQQFLLISNPGAGQARVGIEYTLTDGSKVSDPIFIMPGRSRQTVAVHSLRPGQQAISAIVRASQPIVAERSVYRGDPRTNGNRGGETVLGIPGDLP